MMPKSELVEWSEDKILVRCEMLYAESKGSFVDGLIGMGKALANAHEHLAGKGREGQFGAWLRERCDGLSRTHADRLIKAYRLFDGCRVRGYFSHRAIEYLAKEDTPEEVTKAAIEKARSGVVVTEPFCKELAKEICTPKVTDSRSTEPETTYESSPRVGNLSEDGQTTNVSQLLLDEAEEPEEPLTAAEIVDQHNKTLEAFARGVMKAAKERPALEWLDCKGRWEGYVRKVQQGLETLRSAKCVVCPACDGEKCKVCEWKGYMPKLEAEGVTK